MADERAGVQLWVRIAMVALGVPNALAGLWAVLAPSNWYEDFPGWDPRLVSADPPFNEHLATDAGAGLLASGFVLIAAARLGDRRSVRLGLAAFLVFAVPHGVWHAMNESPGLTSAQDAQNVATLLFSAIAGVVLLVLAGRSSDREASVAEPV